MKTPYVAYPIFKVFSTPPPTPSNTQTNTHTSSIGPVDQHVNIYWYHHLLWAHTSHHYYIGLITHWYHNFTLQRSLISFLFKNYSYAEVTTLLIRLSESIYFLWDTKNTGRICVNEQRTHIPHTPEKDDIRKG